MHKKKIVTIDSRVKIDMFKVYLMDTLDKTVRSELGTK